MPIPVLCPECGAKIIAPDSELGRRMKCPTCGDQITVVSVNDVERDAASSVDASPLDPGWEKVAVGYRMLNFALLFFLLGVFATATTTVAVWALHEQKQVIHDDSLRNLVGWTTAGVCGLVVAVFSFLGHLFLLRMPEDKDGGKGKTLAMVMLAVLFFPGVNAIVPLLLLPIFSAGVGTALNNWRLTNSGWNLFTWYAAGVFAVPMLAYGCDFVGNSFGMPVVGYIAAGVGVVVGWSLTVFAIYRTFAGLRWGIEEAIRERGLRG